MLNGLSIQCCKIARPLQERVNIPLLCGFSSLVLVLPPLLLLVILGRALLSSLLPCLALLGAAAPSKHIPYPAIDLSSRPVSFSSAMEQREEGNNQCHHRSAHGPAADGLVQVASCRAPSRKEIAAGREADERDEQPDSGLEELVVDVPGHVQPIERRSQPG